jgi:hypothetical protein
MAIKKAQAGITAKKTTSTSFKKTPTDIKDAKANKGKAVGVVISKEDEKKHPEDFKYLTRKNGGPVKKAKTGVSLKSVPSDKVGLGKLSTPVRNKMGYKKNGGAMKAKSGTSVKKCKYGCK